MKIPDGRPGTDHADIPTLYNTRLLAYGAAGFSMTDQEPLRGCPRRYAAQYVDDTMVKPAVDLPLSYGRAIHEALRVMEEDAIGPDEALKRVWLPELDLTVYAEALGDLTRYVERGGPLTTKATVAVEEDVGAELYVDEDFGPVWYAAIADAVLIDPSEPAFVGFVDYKTNRAPVSRAQAMQDSQFIGLAWVISRRAGTWLEVANPTVVGYLEAIKFNYTLELAFEDWRLEQFEAWATAIARRILRDEDARPVLNAGCSWCGIRWSCPAWKKLPGKGQTLMARQHLARTDLEGALAWRAEAAETGRNLDAGIKDVDALVAEKAHVEGPFRANGHVFAEVEDWRDEFDAEELAKVLGSAFPSIVAVGKTKLDQFVRNHPEFGPAVEACRRPYLAGSKLSKKKALEERS